MDLIALPIALLILSYFVRSFRLILVPVCSVAIAGCLTFAALYAASYTTIVPTFVPSVAMSLLIGLNVDYSLFICSRLVEELRYQTVPIELALSMTLQTSGAGEPTHHRCRSLYHSHHC